MEWQINVWNKTNKYIEDKSRKRLKDILVISLTIVLNALYIV